MRFEYLVENRILDGENFIVVIQEKILYEGTLNNMKLYNYLELKDAYVERLRGAVYYGNATIEIFLK